MNLIVSRSPLAKAMVRILKVVKAESTMAILKNVLMTAQEDHLELYASGMDHSLRIRLPAEVKAPGASCIRADDFSRIVGSLTAGNLSLVAQKGEKLILSGGGAQYSFAGAKASEYPVLTPTEPHWEARVNPKHLLAALPVALNGLAVRAEVVNPMCKTVSMRFGPNRLELCGTDTHRMGVARLDLTWDHDAPSDDLRCCLMQNTQADSLKGLLGDVDEDLLVGSSHAETIVRCSDWTFQSNLIGIKYPNYQKVLRTAQSVESVGAILNREDFMKAVARLRIFGKSDVNDKDCITMRLRSGLLMLEAAGDKGAASEELEVENEGDADIDVHGDFLSRVLDSLSGVAVTMHYSPARVAPLRFEESLEGVETVSLLTPLTNAQQQAQAEGA